MLTQFIVTHRDSIARRARHLVQERPAPAPTEEELDGLPIFIDQLCEQLLRREGMEAEAGPRIGPTASRRGERLQRLGVTVTQVVHDYGAVCQAVMDVANGEEAEHMGVLVHELRNTIGAVLLGYQSMKRANVSPSESRTGAVIERNLQRLTDLIDRSLSAVRLHAAPELRPETFTLRELLDEIEGPAVAAAEVRGLRLAARAAPPDGELTADRQLVVSALSNLIQNAVKFTKLGGAISVSLREEGDAVVMEVEDECGGLPPGATEKLFEPFARATDEASGVGLGLAIVRRAAEAHGGTVTARDKPGQGCVFTIRLPRSPSR